MHSVKLPSPSLLPVVSLLTPPVPLVSLLTLPSPCILPVISLFTLHSPCLLPVVSLLTLPSPSLLQPPADENRKCVQLIINNVQKY